MTKPAGHLEFYDWWLPSSSPLQDNWFKFVKQDFEAKNPGAVVDFVFVNGTTGYYNKAHPQEVWLDPSPDKTFAWTYQDLVDTATKLAKGSGGDVQRRGIAPPGLSTGNVAAWLFGNGASWYDKDQTKVAFNTPQGVQAVEYILDLIKRFPAPANYAGINNDQQFYTQKTSIVPQGNSNAHVVRGFAPEVDFDMMPLPKGPQGKSSATKTSMNQVIMPRWSTAGTCASSGAGRWSRCSRRWWTGCPLGDRARLSLRQIRTIVGAKGRPLRARPDGQTARVAAVLETPV